MKVRDQINVQNIGIIAIDVDEKRHRSLRPDVIERLAGSIESIGLINPVTVYPDENHDTYHLIAGRHRYEAYKRLKFDNIPAVILEGIDALTAEEIELRENVDRGELTATQQSMHYARLMEIAEIKHKIKKGPSNEDENVNAQVGRKLSDAARANSAVAVSQDTGRSATSVERDARRVKSIKGIGDVVGTSLDSGVELDALARLTEDTQRGIIQRALDGEKVSARTELKKQERAVRERELGEKQIALPDGKYGLIYCDPPWQFKTRSDKGMDRSADNHYPCSPTDKIGEIAIQEIADKNCVCFMWATAPMFPDALNLLERWGFTYKTHMIWVKNKMATGYWFRNQHEILVVGTKGLVPAPAPGSQFSSVLMCDVKEHSVKPDEFYKIIESYYPTFKKIELFARRPRDGWTAWGFDAPKQDTPDEDDAFIPEFLKTEREVARDDDDLPF
jgi:N6-adenosine-specific RNA methylase IME4/ParB-like chromosome segregation protein Spo0J